MAKLESPDVPHQGRTAQPNADHNSVSDSPACASALTAADQESIGQSAVAHQQLAKHAPLELNDDELWGLKAVIAKTALSRSSLYGYINRGIFPRQRRLGPRRVAWLASEVRAWIISRPS